MEDKILMSPYEMSGLINLEFSEHALMRTQQRGLTKLQVKMALLYAEAFFKQGLIFYTVKKSYFPEYLPYDLKKN